MSDDEPVAIEPADDTRNRSWASRHPRIMILLIAAIFYVILFGMCGFVLILLLRG